MSTDRLPPVPSVEEYQRVLARLQAELPERHVELLRAHYRSPRHTATAAQLAEAVGYAGWRAVNLQYGKLGKRLRESLDCQLEGQASYAIATFVSPGTASNAEWLWVMHPELAQALEQLGWT